MLASALDAALDEVAHAKFPSNPLYIGRAVPKLER